MEKILVSPNPHIHGKLSTRRLMGDVLIALAPAVLVSFWFAGFAAMRVFFIAVAGCALLEWLIQRFIMKRPSTIGDLSALLTGALLALNLPASSPWWMVLIGCVVAIGIAKMTFGGLGNNLFNPALVGRVFLLVSFPVQMTNWAATKPLFGSLAADAVSGATPLGIIKEGLKAGIPLKEIMASHGFDGWAMLWGTMDGSLGEASALALLLGLVYLLARKVIRPHIPFSILLTVVVFGGILWLVRPEQYMNPLYHLLTGGLLLGAIFMATDYVTSPMAPWGMVVYGIGIGLLTVIIRTWGAYPEGVSFAILLMNACTPLFNRWFIPRRYGEEVHRG